jgi:HNH endonuclease
MTKQLLPQDLNELLRYDQLTGKLFWRERTMKHHATLGSMNAFNRAYAGKEAFTTQSSHGYFVGRIFEGHYYAHRVIFAMVKGYWPEEVDHDDKNRANNRWYNLKEVTHEQNMNNRTMRKDNKTGLPGVCFDKKLRKYRAFIRKDGKQRHLGCFDIKEAAHKAYLEALATKKDTLSSLHPM